MDAFFLDGDALHRGGRPVVGTVDHNGNVMRVRSHRAMRIFHADGEIKLHLVAELKLIGGIAFGFGLGERVFSGRGIQMERAVVGLNGDSVFALHDIGNLDIAPVLILPRLLIKERQFADHITRFEGDGVVILVGEVIRQLVLIAGVHVCSAHRPLAHVMGGVNGLVVRIETGFRHSERIFGLGDEGLVIGAFDGDGDGLFRPCAVLVAHIDGEGFGFGFRGAVLVEAESVCPIIQRVGVCTVRIKSQRAVLARGRIISLAHAAIAVVVRFERGIAVVAGGAHAEFERVIGIGVSALERTGDGISFLNFIIGFVVALRDGRHVFGIG